MFYGKIKQNNGIKSSCRDEGGGAILYKLVREELSDEMTIELRRRQLEKLLPMAREVKSC